MGSLNSNLEPIKTSATLHGEVAVAFRRYLEVEGFKVSTGIKVLVVKGLVDAGYLPKWWLENNLSRVKIKSGIRTRF